MAIPEIERILSCDESGRAAIEKARKDAEMLVASAEEEISRYRQETAADLEEFREKEISKILDDARKKAAQMDEEARAYCEGLKKLFSSHEDELVSDFISRFYQAAGIKG